MDGYTDLALLNSMGASDGFASYYVYDPAAGIWKLYQWQLDGADPGESVELGMTK